MNRHGLPLDGLIFDIDGTLADNLPAIFEALRHGLATVSPRRYLDWEIEELFGPTVEEILQMEAGLRWEQGVEAFLERYAANAQPQVIRLEGIDDLLAWATGLDLKLGVVTGGHHSLASITLAALDIHHHFDAISTNQVPSVPKRRSLAAIAREWDLDPRRIAYVGDSPNDMRSARAAGMVPLGAAWGQGARPHRLWGAGAVEVFDHPRRLHQWLQAHQRSATA